jgi:lipoate-protein ligase A
LTRPWRVEPAFGRARDLLDPWASAEAGERVVRFLHCEDRAVVLGSTQPETDIDPAAAKEAGTEILRRRSGGGAVLVGPDQVVWADVIVPAGDPLWTADVGRAFWWLGDAWAATLAAAGMAGAAVWRGALVRTRWSDRMCFAGLGPGEVTVGAAKVVGLSQRRTRAGAHFQCAVAITWRPSELLALLVLDDDTRAQAASELAPAAMGVGPGVAAQLIPLFVDHLP